MQISTFLNKNHSVKEQKRGFRRDKTPLYLIGLLELNQIKRDVQRMQEKLQQTNPNKNYRP
jgi:hypothetical protein